MIDAGKPTVPKLPGHRLVVPVAAAGALAMERYIPVGLRRIPHEEAAIPALAEPAPV